jgi:hypothetical protein
VDTIRGPNSMESFFFGWMLWKQQATNNSNICPKRTLP